MNARSSLVLASIASVLGACSGPTTEDPPSAEVSRSDDASRTKTADPKTADSKTADSKTTDSKTADSKTAEPPSRGGLAGQVAAVRKELEKEPRPWSTYQGDIGRTGWARDVPPIKSPQIRWKTRVGIQGYLNAPLLLGDVIVVPSSGSTHNAPDDLDGVHALDIRTGTERWHAASASDANGATAFEDLVVFTSDDGKVQALERATGTPRWSVQRAGAVYSTPLTLDSMVVVGDARGFVVALDGATGSILWEKRYSGAIRGGLASDGTHIFVSSQGGDVAALQTSGREAWRKSVTRLAWSGSAKVPIEGYNAPVVDGEQLIVPFARDTYYDSGPALVALSIADGSERWQAKPGTVSESWGNLRSSPALADGVLVWAEPYSGDVAGLDTATGVVRYRVRIGDCLFPQYGSPVIATDTAYVPRQDGHLYAIDVATGEFRWAMNLQLAHAAAEEGRRGGSSHCDWDSGSGSPLYAPPAIAEDGTVFVGSGEGIVYAIENRTPPVPTPSP